MPATEAPCETARGYRGWRVVGACFVIAIFSWALGFYGHGVYLAEFALGRGWSSAVVSTATTAYYLVSAAMLAFVGDAIGRFGPRAVVLTGIGAFALSALLIGRVEQPWQLFPAYLVMAVGWATLTAASISNILGLWFDARRGLALSLALNGASAGGIAGVPLLVWLTGAIGFGEAMAVAAAATLIILVPVASIWIGAPEGHAGARHRSAAATGAGAGAVALARSRRAWLITGRFWTATAPFAIGLAAQVGFLVHQISFLEPRIGSDGAALAVAATTAMAVAGRIGLGIWIDRLDLRVVTAASLLSQAAALAWATQASAPAAIVAACAVVGLSVGNLITLPALVIQREFPPAVFGRLTALAIAINQIAYAFGPTLLGAVRDATGGYGASLALCIVMQCTAAVVALAGRLPRRPSIS
jgi:MFS family permease